MSTAEARPSGSNTTGQRRPRPHSYTPQACERCRTRKQRCIIEGESEEPCKNCVDSGSACVYAPRGEKSKRSRGGSSQPVRTEEDESPPKLSSPPSFIPMPGQQNAQHPQQQQQQQQQQPVPTSQFNPTMRSFAMSAPVNTRSTLPSQMETAHARTPAAPNWQHPMLAPQNTSGSQPTSQPTEMDWRMWLSQLPLQAHQTQNDQPPLVTTPLQQTLPQQPLPSSEPPSRNIEVASASNASPRTSSESHSVFETAKGLAMISLEAAAEPHYVGESSGSLWTTLVAKGMQAAPSLNTSKAAHMRPSRSPSPSRRVLLRQSLARTLPKEVAEFVLQSVYCHLHSRYPFMDWLAFEKYWRIRDEVLVSISQGAQLDKNASVAAFFILMILAIGSQYCKQQHLPELLRARDYYTLALPYLNYIVQLHNMANVQGLLLLAVYSLRDSRGPSVWYLSGVAVRLCIGLGLHRNPAGRASRVLPKYTIEMRKRVFWTCYTLDRMMSMLLGRPPGISDDDIDIDLPEPYNPETEPALPAMRNGSMVSSLHYIKLKRIESQIQRAVYTVSNRKPSRDAAEFWPLLGLIDQWEMEIPLEASSDERWSEPCCSKDWFHLRGVEARLHLLRPLCMDQLNTSSTFLPHLAQNAARGCELQKRLHLLGTPNSSSSVHSTFICGLALLYAVFLRPAILPLAEVFSAIKAASNTLFAYSRHEGTPGALYDVFEALSTVCIDKVSQKSVSNSPGNLTATAGDWQKVSSEATSNIESASASEYVDFLRTLGIDMESEPISAALPEASWDLGAFSTGNMLFNNDQSGGVGMMF